MKRITYIILLFSSMLSCSSSDKDIELEQALQSAGKNRKNLEGVLNHYKPDSLKYKAACFLIKYMPYHYSLEEYYLSPKRERYRPDILKFKQENDLKRHCDSLIHCGYIKQQHIVHDVTSIDSTFLINNIDLAFKVWRKPWSKNVTFDNFCRYILPYRVKNEIKSNLREKLMKRFLPLLETSGVKTSLEACVVLNKYLRFIMKYQKTDYPFYPTINETYQTGIGQCDGLCNLGIFIMRSVGIPVTIDFTIWPKMDLGHSWCVVFNNGRFYSFGPGEDQPNIHSIMLSKKRHRRPAKVYRYQFAPLNHKIQAFVGEYKTFLNNPLLYDVTNDYLDKPTSFQLPIVNCNDRINKYVYLCVYNHYEWRPIAIGTYVANGTCLFKNIVGDNIFIIANGINDKVLRYISAPFYVDKSGHVHPFIPQLKNKRPFIFKKKIAGRIYTLHYWDTNRKSFIPIPYKKSTDTTQIYEKIPNNALLWFTLPERIFNQRIFFIKNDSIQSY